jgi:hypothetical protein
MSSVTPHAALHHGLSSFLDDPFARRRGVDRTTCKLSSVLTYPHFRVTITLAHTLVKIFLTRQEGKNWCSLVPPSGPWALSACSAYARIVPTLPDSEKPLNLKDCYSHGPWMPVLVPPRPPWPLCYSQPGQAPPVPGRILIQPAVFSASRLPSAAESRPGGNRVSPGTLARLALP